MAINETTLENRLQLIETKLNEIQTAFGNLASRAMLKQYSAILQSSLTGLRNDLEQAEITGAGPALEAHKTADHHTQYHTDVRGDLRYYTQSVFIDTTAGAGDAGKPVKLNENGLLDPSLVSLSFEDHGELGGLDDDDHTQYFNTIRGDARYSQLDHTHTNFDEIICSGVIVPSGQIGIGTSEPEGILHIVSPLTESDIDIVFEKRDGWLQYSSDVYTDSSNAYAASHSAFVMMRKARGSPEAPEPVQEGDTLGGISWRGWDGASWLQPSLIMCDVDGEVDINNVPTSLVFYTGTRYRYRRMVIGSDGKVGIGTTTPNELLTLEGVLSLQEQDDYSETHDGYGSIWAKSDGKLYFTNDLGTEYDLTSQGLEVVSGLNGRIAFFTSDDSIAGHDDLFWNQEDNKLELTGSGGLSCAGPLNVSGAANIYSVTTTADVTIGTGRRYLCNGRYQILSSSDGNVTLAGWSTTALSSLIFGAGTSAYPAIVPVGSELHFKTGDLADFTSLTCDHVNVYDSIKFSEYSKIKSSVDGDLLIDNAASTGFNMLKFGGETSLFPALKVSGIELQVRLADDSNYAYLRCHAFNAQVGITSGGPITAAASSAFKWNTRSRLYAPSDGNILITNNAQDGFGLLQFGGSDNTCPALKRENADLQVRLADDSNYAQITAGTFYAITRFRVYPTGRIEFGGRSEIRSSADGYLELFNDAQSDFTGLRFGGTTATEPMIKRDGTGFQATLADDSAVTTFESIVKATGLTTTERDALSAEAGMIIFNTTVSGFQGYNGTTWQDLV